MTVGIAGLGLIGGSLAKAYHEAGERVLAYNRSRSVLDFAVMSGAVDGELTAENISECDILLLAMYPEACFAAAREYGVTFIGGHPMAGTHNSGFKYARANLFHGAPMVMVPPDPDDVELLEHAEKLLAPAGFGKFSITTAEKHDEMIAFTSQMAHVISNAYIKSPTAGQHKGFSAGSYKDMTRVAWLNPDMWAELFLENRDNLINEIDCFMRSMQQYRDALADGSRQELVQLLDEGRKRKAEVDGR